MFHLISKPLIVALSVAFNHQLPFEEHPVTQPEYQVCHEYHLMMRDIGVGSLEGLVKRNKKLELMCGVYRPQEPEN